MNSVVRTFRVSVHEGQDPIRPEHGHEPGWIRVEQGVPQMGLRAVVRELRGEGYEDSAILIESECANATGEARCQASPPAKCSACDWCNRQVGTHVFTNDIGDRFLRRNAHKDGKGHECLHSLSIIEELPNTTGEAALPARKDA